MNIERLASDAGVAFFAQGVSMLINVLITLILPKILGVDGFGYWQLFIFYSSFVGFFHFGINDGVYLLKGGEDRNVIDKRSLNSQFLFAFIMQCALASAVIVAAITCESIEERAFVIIATAIYLPLNNGALYLGYVFQAMNETRLFSFSLMADRVPFCIALCFLVLSGTASFVPYVIISLTAKCMSLLYCIWKGRDIIATRPLPLAATLKDISTSIHVGIKLMLATIAAQLILGVSRFVIDARWGIEAFSEFSLAISLVNFFLVFIQQISMVLFPALRQCDEMEMKAFFSSLRDAMGMVLPLIYLLFIPMKLFLIAWLPAYGSSIEAVALLLPLCVFDGMTDVLCTTYYKVLRKESMLLAINLGAVAFATIGALIAAWVFQSTILTMLSAVVTFAIRFFFLEGYIAKHVNARISALEFGELVIAIVFIASASMLSDLVSFIVCLLALVMFYYVFRNKAKETIRRLSNSIKPRSR